MYKATMPCYFPRGLTYDANGFPDLDFLSLYPSRMITDNGRNLLTDNLLAKIQQENKSKKQPKIQGPTYKPHVQPKIRRAQDRRILNSTPHHQRR